MRTAPRLERNRVVARALESSGPRHRQRGGLGLVEREEQRRAVNENLPLVLLVFLECRPLGQQKAHQVVRVVRVVALQVCI
jgi:hypothetical protein